ncbi:hypothetical protein EMCRGX_G024218 [Ephydatia muelleri]|eukprot:Em0015g395a
MACSFKFDLATPLLTGTLSKKGRTGIFKKRFFVLYPDFLVYYNDSRTWHSDVWRRSLSGRSGAIYLKNATCVSNEKCAFGLLVTAPDKRNNKRSLLLYASNVTEQSDWIAAILNATPPSSRICSSTFVAAQGQDVAQKDVQRCGMEKKDSMPLDQCNPDVLVSTAFIEATTWTGGLAEDRSECH